jgi:plasmid stability protein
MKTLTVRNLPKQVAEALNRERRRSDRSLNQTVIDVLSRGLGIGAEGPRRNGLAKLAGTWTEADLQQFNEAVAAFDAVDSEMWAE